jgi:transcriptional regulator with XRE-family HTH domain
MTHKALIETAEELRRKLNLSTTDMSRMVGVSRAAYYNWLIGTNIQKARAERVERQLKRVVRVLTEQDFPTWRDYGLSRKLRAQRLLELMALYD